jgi:hypothetical protein
LDKNVETFLKELSALSKRYGIEIAGCGCCGSPYLEDTNGKVLAEDLFFDLKTNDYDAIEVNEEARRHRRDLHNDNFHSAEFDNDAWDDD